MDTTRSRHLADLRKRRRGLPRHIAVVMGGNDGGRPLKLRQGVKSAERLAEFVADELGIGYLTLLALPTPIREGRGQVLKSNTVFRVATQDLTPKITRDR